MRYADLKFNDATNGEGICVSFWTQGCPHKCPNCFNPETWDYTKGLEFTEDTLKKIISGLKANGVKRNFSILGGEPLCKENLPLTTLVIKEVRKFYPEIKIYLWTGYTLEELQKRESADTKYILNSINVLIDGKYIDSKRDITLKLRGSSNQRILKKGLDF